MCGFPAGLVLGFVLGEIMTANEWFRFWSKVEKTRTCWLWQAGKTSDGYGSFYFRGKCHRAHRFIYQILKREVPKRLTLDHICRVHNCVNPSHLEVVTQGENTLRGFAPSAINAQKTHCINGHALDGDNLIIRSKFGQRQCGICRRRYNREQMREIRRNKKSAQAYALLAVRL